MKREILFKFSILNSFHEFFIQVRIKSEILRFIIIIIIITLAILIPSLDGQRIHERIKTKKKTVHNRKRFLRDGIFRKCGNREKFPVFFEYFIATTLHSKVRFTGKVHKQRTIITFAGHNHREHESPESSRLYKIFLQLR